MSLTAKQEKFCPPGHYVYTLIDPRDGLPFYIGKGTGRRMYQHERAVLRGRGINKAKCERIAAILADGLVVEYGVISRHADEAAAYRAERAAIASHANLTNANPGGGGGWCGVHVERQEDPRASLAKAEDLRDRVMPYVDWLNEKPRTNQESDWYFFVVREIGEVIEMCKRQIAQQMLRTA